MSYSIACGDVMPGCSAHFTAPTEDELLAQVAEHAKDDHGVEEITPEIAGQVRAAISED